RKLPELGKSLGKSIAEFKKASNELKSTLEEEVRAEERKSAERIEAPRTFDAPLQQPQATGTEATHASGPRQNGSAEAAERALVPSPSATPGDDEEPDYEDSGSKMSFLEHLDELRKRLIYVIYGLIAGCGIAYLFIQRIVDLIMKP